MHPLERTWDMELLLAYRRVEYAIPIEVEAADIESNLVSSI